MRSGPRSSSGTPHTALLLIDVINDMDFPGSEALVRLAGPMAKNLRALKRRARAAGIPTIYINDNFGKWRSDFRATVEYCLRRDVPGHHEDAEARLEGLFRAEAEAVSVFRDHARHAAEGLEDQDGDSHRHRRR
jgi:nicotinamidase-related amidase